MAPENDRPAVAILLCEHVVQHHSETVQVTDVQRTEIRVECIVQQAVVDGEVYGRRLIMDGLGSLLRSGRPLAGRSRLLGSRVRERRVLVGLMGVGSEVKAVFNVENRHVRNGLSGVINGGIPQRAAARRD